ncbi:hypothetical protein M0R45_006901 [Rubus argutus]|uniref:Uncharacterized protein n=1 Tax=Rubus argutus TaxID=59490 RepID=A0AAW1YSM2_RUBAR
MGEFCVVLSHPLLGNQKLSALYLSICWCNWRKLKLVWILKEKRTRSTIICSQSSQSFDHRFKELNLNLNKHFSSFLLATCHLDDNSVTKHNWNEFPIPQGTPSIVRLFSLHKELHLMFATNKGTLHDLGSAFCKKFAVIDSNSDFVTLM